MPKPFLRLLALATALGLLAGCRHQPPAGTDRATSHRRARRWNGRSSSPARSAKNRQRRLAVPLAGLVNLSRPAAAGWKNRDEPIQIYAHLLKHPRYGYFLIDSGVSERFLREPGKVGVSWLMRQAMPIHTMQLRKSTAQILQDIDGKLAGCFSPICISIISPACRILPTTCRCTSAGARRASRSGSICFVQASTDHLLAAAQAAAARMAVPARSAAALRRRGGYFRRRQRICHQRARPHRRQHCLPDPQHPGPVLLTGDASHTRWGWEHGVEPGDFTRNNELNLQSLLQMKALVERHPQIEVRFTSAESCKANTGAVCRHACAALAERSAGRRHSGLGDEGLAHAAEVAETNADRLIQRQLQHTGVRAGNHRLAGGNPARCSAGIRPASYQRRQRLHGRMLAGLVDGVAADLDLQLQLCWIRVLQIDLRPQHQSLIHQPVGQRSGKPQAGRVAVKRLWISSSASCTLPIAASISALALARHAAADRARRQMPAPVPTRATPLRANRLTAPGDWIVRA